MILFTTDGTSEIDISLERSPLSISMPSDSLEIALRLSRPLLFSIFAIIIESLGIIFLALIISSAEEEKEWKRQLIPNCFDWLIHLTSNSVKWDSLKLFPTTSKALLTKQEPGVSIIPIADVFSIDFNNLPYEFDLLFIDPPFREKLIQKSLNFIKSKNILSPNAVIYLECEKELDLKKITEATVSA